MDIELWLKRISDRYIFFLINAQKRDWSKNSGSEYSLFWQNYPVSEPRSPKFNLILCTGKKKFLFT